MKLNFLQFWLKRKSKKPSVKEQIEKTHGVADREIAWFKKPRKELRRALALEKERYIIHYGPTEGEKFIIHTHPRKAIEKFGALPSFDDINTLLRYGARGTITTGVISRIDEKGKEIGRTYIKLTRGFFEKGLTKEHGEWIEKYAKASKEDKLKLIKEAGKLGIVVRFVPMPGYAFDEKIVDFVKRDVNAKKA